MKRFFLYVWQLPQNLLGLAAVKLYKPNKSYTFDNGVEIHYSKMLNGGISLGKYVVLASFYWRQTMEDSLKRDTVRHNAVGHTRQSRILGWFYLPIMAISLCIDKLRGAKNKYNWGMERWADKIADVER